MSPLNNDFLKTLFCLFQVSEERNLSLLKNVIGIATVLSATNVMLQW